MVGTATEELLLLQEAADRLGVSVYTVRRWIKEGKLRAFKPGKEYRIREADLEEFLRAREVRPKAPRRSPYEPTLNDALADAERHDIDVAALDEALAEVLRQQREFRLQELDIKLERAGNDEERREEAYRNLKNWWVWFTQPVMTLHKFIPEIPGPALLREGDITVERVREFARRGNVSEAQRDAELQTLEEMFGNAAHVGSE